MVTPLRIAHVTATFPPYQGGTGNVCLHNALELARRGHVVEVFSSAVQGTAAVEQLEQVKVSRLAPLLQVGNAPVLPKLAYSLSHFDIIHLHYPFFGGEFAAFAARKQCIPLVITYHQDVHLVGWTGLVERLLRPTVERWTLRSARRVLFTSHDYRQASQITRLLKGKERDLGVLPNGVDVAQFSPGDVPQELLRRFKKAPGEQVVLLVASLDRAHYFKGVGILLQSLSELPEAVKGIIIGQGDKLPEYWAIAQRLGLTRRVHFLGHVPTAELPDYYRLADVTVLPSTTMGEAFGLVLLESLACGTPVIASDLPGVRSVVGEAKDGFLVQPGDVGSLRDGLTHLLGLPAEARAEMGRSGRQKVEAHYTWAHIASNLEAVYLECRRAIDEHR